jgi:hypothetical protein
MNVQLCKSCGNAFDLDEFQDGYCDSCLPDSGEMPEEPPAIDWDRVVSDCV